ncbi:hypothetical protein MBT84_29060 [Streptomyces sp. MBT84]|nr:hypothetical protein [Streptomyces sp. MBT84]
MYRAAVPQGDPDTAVGVDGEPVGEAAVDVGQRTPACRESVVAHIEDVDPPGRRVDVVHQPAVGAPARAVADGDVVQHRQDLAVGCDPGQRATAGCLVVPHGARPQ